MADSEARDAPRDFVGASSNCWFHCLRRFLNASHGLLYVKAPETGKQRNMPNAISLPCALGIEANQADSGNLILIMLGGHLMGARRPLRRRPTCRDSVEADACGFYGALALRFNRTQLMMRLTPWRQSQQ